MTRKALPSLLFFLVASCSANTDVDEKPMKQRSLGATPSQPVSPSGTRTTNGDGSSAVGTPSSAQNPAPRGPALGATPGGEVPKGPSLSLMVENIRTIQGKLCYSIFDEAHASSFGKDGITASEVALANCIPVTAGSQTITVTSLPAGNYAVALFHDQNGNGLLDKAGPLGIPAEGFGFSRNPPLGFGAPAFDKCQFSLPAAGMTETVKLLYVLP